MMIPEKRSLPPCEPPLWARSGHSQTLLGFLLPSQKFCFEANGESHQVRLQDGDALSLRWVEGTSNYAVSLFHGLTGSIDSSYVHRAATQLSGLGHTIVAVNHRGCGSGRGLAKGPYHSGSSNDIAAVQSWIQDRRPDLRKIAIGFSLSGNALLLLAGDTGLTQPDAAISVNPPINLKRSSELINAGWNRLYQHNFVQGAKASIRERVRDGLLDQNPAFPRRLSLREFDDLYTAPAGGFEDALDYYRTCSAFDKLDRISIPTWVLSAEDDPFIPPDDFFAAKKSNHVRLHMERRGGHLGYLSRHLSVRGVRWLDRAIVHLLEEAIETLEDSSPTTDPG